MNLLFSNHIKVANKWLILLSGINKNAMNKDGKKSYEKKDFNLPKAWTAVNWSKTKMKQILAYLGLSNSKGELGVVDLEELASILQCSIRSLKNNNKTFVELGLVAVDELYGDLVHIKLINYLPTFVDIHKETSYSDEEKVNSFTGYTTIKKEVLFDLFKIKNVNILRIACRLLFLYEKEVNLGGKSAVLLPSEMLKGFLPTYFSYRPIIERSIRLLNRIFNVEIFSIREDKKELLKKHKTTPSIIDKFKSPYVLSAKLHPEKDSRLVAKQEDNNIVDLNMLHTLSNTLGAKMIDDVSFGELVYEYGRKSVEQAFDDIMACYKYNLESISEVGVDTLSEIKKLKWNNQPIQILRNIFRKYAISLQEGYLFQF